MPKPELTPEQHKEAQELLNRAAEFQKPFLDDLRKLERLLGMGTEAKINLTAVALRELIVALDIGFYNELSGPCV